VGEAVVVVVVVAPEVTAKPQAWVTTEGAYFWRAEGVAEVARFLRAPAVVKVVAETVGV